VTFAHDPEQEIRPDQHGELPNRLMFYRKHIAWSGSLRACGEQAKNDLAEAARLLRSLAASEKP
jgi:hypothetical protein